MGFSAAWALASIAGAQVTTPEVEPNDNKAAAQLVTMACGDIITGTTTGTSTTVAGAASADYFRIRTTATGGLTEYTLTITQAAAAVPAQTVTIRGLSQSGGVIGTTDNTAQTATATGAPANSKINRWYGHGPAGANQDIYVRVTGTSTTTNPYFLTLTCTPVTPTAIAGTLFPDTPVKVAPDPATDTAMDSDFWVYDSSLTPIPTYGHDDADITGVSRSCAPGTYYVAMGNANLANNQASPPDDTFLSGTVLDFPNVTSISSTTVNIASMNCVVSNTSGTLTGTGSRGATDTFRCPWYSFTVVPNTQPTPPSGVGSSSPTNVISGFGGHDTALLKVVVTPGVNPPSTGLAVTADLSAIGGSATQAFYDDGTHGDVTAGDNQFSYAHAVGAGMTSGNYSVPFTISDNEHTPPGGSGTLSVGVQSMTDLGTLSLPQVVTSPNATIPTGTIAWFKFTIPSVSVADNDWLDIVSSATLSGGTYTNDSYMAVYNSGGTVEDSDDDDGPSALSALSYGLTTPTRPNGDGVAFNGRDGSLAAGTYYIAIGGYSCSFAANFTASSTSNHTAGNTVGVTLNLNQPTNPTVACNSSGALAGSAVLITGTVTPGQNPASTGITVTGNLSAIGGAAAQQFYDDGSNGDVTAGDNIFSYSYTIPVGTAGGSYNVPLVVSDSLARTGTCTAVVSVDETGSLPATAVAAGTGPVTGQLSAGDVDMYLVHICDPANFSAAVSGATVSDTQLFLFRADGTGVAMNDDYPAGSLNTSTLTGAVVQSIPAGDYYLAISSYDNDPVDAAAAALWLDTPYDTVRAPDGAAAANPVASWDGAGSNTGTYTINLTGVSASSCAPNVCCRNDYNGDGDVGTDLDIENFFSCLGGTCCPTCPPNADFNCDGDVGTDLDIESFFRVLGGGPC